MLPAAFPNLLVNGTSGIAVGMATNMIPHNLGEVVGAARWLITHPNATLDKLMEFVPGPDLPTGGMLLGLDEVREAYETGRGVVRMRAQGRDRPAGGQPWPSGDHGHRAAVRRRPGEGHREDHRRGEQVQAAHRDRRRQGPHRPGERHPAGDRVQGRGEPAGAAGRPLPAHADGAVVRHQQPGPGRRAAADVGAQGVARGVPRAPLRRRDAADALPARASARTGCTWSRACSRRCSTSTR